VARGVACLGNWASAVQRLDKKKAGGAVGSCRGGGTEEMVGGWGGGGPGFGLILG